VEFFACEIFFARFAPLDWGESWEFGGVGEEGVVPPLEQYWHSIVCKSLFLQILNNFEFSKCL